MSIATNGSLIPNVSGVPLDARAVCSNLESLSSIENPYVGLRIWIEDLSKEVVVKSLSTVGVGIFSKTVIGEVEDSPKLSDLSVLSLTKPAGKNHLIITREDGSVVLDTSSTSLIDGKVKYYKKSSTDSIGSWESVLGSEGIPDSADGAVVSVDLSELSEFPVFINYSWFSSYDDYKDWNGAVVPSTRIDTGAEYTDDSNTEDGDAPNYSGYVNITVDDITATYLYVSSDTAPVYVELDGKLYTPEGVVNQGSQFAIPLEYIIAEANKDSVVGNYRVWLSSGPAGEDGKTPVKGSDYFTEEEVEDIVSEVLSRVQQSGSSPEHQEIHADDVKFENTVYTSYAIGNVQLTDGLGILANAGDSLSDMLENVFLKESNPSITQPSVSITFGQAGSYEAGSYITPTYSATFSPGSYQYGGKNADGDVVKSTGVVVSSWSVSDSLGRSSSESSGTFDEIQLTDGTTYNITAVATHSEGYVPVTNLKNEYTSGRISSGVKTKTSSNATCYRNTFYGTTTDKVSLTSASIRDLAKSGKALVDGSVVSVPVPVGAVRVVFAYPSGLRDLTSVKDVNGLNAEIVSGFSKTLIDVEGAEGYTAVPYKVYTIEFASANDTVNTYTITI